MKAFRILAHFNMSSGSVLQNKLTQKSIKRMMVKMMSTVDQKDAEYFSTYKNIWWDKKKLAPLNAFNGIRMELIRNSLANVGFKSQNPARSLDQLKIVDVGCGGGILSECLARAGAQVIGIDTVADSIDIAKQHIQLDPDITDRVDYVCTTIEEFSRNHMESYDVVIASEVVEHVANVDLFLKECINILKPGGSIFITTINKTWASWLGAIILAEYVFRIVPLDTHQWNKFIAPHEIQCILDKYGCRTKLIHGLHYDPLRNKWSWLSHTQILYALHAVKQKVDV